MHFIITFAHEHPQGDGKSRCSRKNSMWGAFISIIMECFFSPFGGRFLHGGGGGGFFLLMRRHFQAKISVGAHALAARVVAHISPLGNLKAIVKLNLLIHFGAHFHIMLRKSMKRYDVIIMAPFCVNFLQNWRFMHLLRVSKQGKRKKY